jgi:ribonuclease P protein component
MISRTHRFHGHNSLQYVYKRGQLVRASKLALKYSPNPRRRHYRAAVVVSRKVSKSAVVRNRIRRRLYEVIRSLSDEFQGVFDLVFLVYDEKLAAEPAEALQRDVRKLCQKAGIISGQRPAHGIVKAKE